MGHNSSEISCTGHGGHQCLRGLPGANSLNVRPFQTHGPTWAQLVMDHPELPDDIGRQIDK